MAYELIFVSVAIVGSLAGLVTDLKARWVPDWTNHFMIFFGLAGHAIISLKESSIWPFALSLGVAGIFYGISLIMFYSGSWGGGDAKLLIGYGALLPTFTPIAANYQAAFWPFPATLWLNIILFGAAFGLASIIYLIAKNRERFYKNLKDKLNENKKIIYAVTAAVVVVSLAGIFVNNSLIVAALTTYLFMFLFLAMKSVENVAMIKEISAKRLVEGDWLATEIKVGGMHIKASKTGLDLETIEKLRKLEADGKISGVKVKEGLPYVPAMFAGLLASLFYGDLMFQLISKLV